MYYFDVDRKEGIGIVIKQLDMNMEAIGANYGIKVTPIHSKTASQ